MPPPIQLRVENGHLQLSDRGRSIVNSSNPNNLNVHWIIVGPTIKSFKLVCKSHFNPFTTPIPEDFNTNIQLKVIEGFRKEDWEYGIIWKDKNDNETTVDPIIAIRPSNHSEEFLYSSEGLVKVFVAVLAIFTAAFLFLKIRKK